MHISSLQNTLRRRPTCPLCRGNVNGEVSFNAIVPDTDDKEEEEEDVIPNVFENIQRAVERVCTKLFVAMFFRRRKKKTIFFKYLF